MIDQQTNARPIYLFDIDGTLADLSHRLHFIQGNPQQWDAFFLACNDDAPIYQVISTAKYLATSGALIFLVSGRSDISRKATTAWLDRYEIPWAWLLMRKEGDHRQDNVVKSELLDAILAHYPKEQIIAAFEDRDQVVKMYRERGLRVFQVADGNF